MKWLEKARERLWVKVVGVLALTFAAVMAATTPHAPMVRPRAIAAARDLLASMLPPSTRIHAPPQGGYGPRGSSARATLTLPVNASISTR